MSSFAGSPFSSRGGGIRLNHLKMVAGCSLAGVLVGFMFDSSAFVGASLGLLGIALVYIGQLMLIREAKDHGATTTVSLMYPILLTGLIVFLAYQYSLSDNNFHGPCVTPAKIEALHNRLQTLEAAQNGKHTAVTSRKIDSKSQTTSTPGNCKIEDGTDFRGGDLNGDAVTTTGPEQCCKKCIENSMCVAFSFNRSTQQCWLKSRVQGRKAAKGVHSGTVPGR